MRSTLVRALALSAAVGGVFAAPAPHNGEPDGDHGDTDCEPTGTVKEEDCPKDCPGDHGGECDYSPPADYTPTEDYIPTEDYTPTEEPCEETWKPEEDEYLESLPLPTGIPPPMPYVVEHHNVTEHGPYDGPDPTTIGALSTDVLATALPVLPPDECAYDYPADGELHGDQPVPYAPSGGIGTNGSAPVYRVQSDFDYQSLALALYQEWIELDLFYWGLATFSDEDFEAEGLTAEDRHLLQYMADQEIGHATVVSSMLGPQAPKQCTYNYPVANVREYVDFSQKLTRWGESGVYGFLPHLNSGPAAQLLLQSITVEARQQMTFRQFGGMFPMPEWHIPGLPQSWAWTLLAPYISSCPYNQTRLVWQNFPALHILNQPNPGRINPREGWNETTGGWANTASTEYVPQDALCANSSDSSCKAAVTHNRSIPLSYPGREVYLQWESPGQPVGPNNSYITSTPVDQPMYAAWVSQLNVTYTPLLDINPENKTAWTIQPDPMTWIGDPMINSTMFLALTDVDLFVTPYNMTAINPHVAALGVYQAG